MCIIAQEGLISGDQGLVANWLLCNLSCQLTAAYVGLEAVFATPSSLGIRANRFIGLCLLSDEFVSIRLELGENIIAFYLGR
jgi:hypothetical protein